MTKESSSSTEPQPNAANTEHRASGKIVKAFMAAHALMLLVILSGLPEKALAGLLSEYGMLFDLSISGILFLAWLFSIPLFYRILPEFVEKCL